MPILGAHMSIAGGCDRAVWRAGECGCDCVQLFTKNNSRWEAPPLTATQAADFRGALLEYRVSHPLAHTSYLINLASPDRTLWQRSVEALIVELERAEMLGMHGLVLHPGAYVEGSPRAGLRRVMRALDQVHRRLPDAATRCLLETTAGQGTSLGHTFDELAQVLEGVRHSERLGICLDTCHLFAAGYRLAPRAAYQETMGQLDERIGLHRLSAIHVNDSKRDLGSRVDRHEHIGLGKLGIEPFRLLMRDRRLRQVPMYLETPKGHHASGRNWDEINLELLRGLSRND